MQIKIDSLERQKVLEKRLKQSEDQIEKEKKEQWSMVIAGDAVDIAPDRKLEMYDEQTVKWNERLGTAGRAEFIGMRDLGLETAKEIEKVNEGFLRAIYKLNGSPEVTTSQKAKLEYRLPGQ